MKAHPKRVYGIGAEFASPQALFEAAERVRDAGFKRWDVHSPFPIHGMDRAMGIGKSWLSVAVLCGGTLGFLTAIALQFYPSWIEYPLVVHGKPTNFFSVPAFFPIMFELTILFSAFAAVGSMLVMNGLPRWHHPVFNWDRFKKATDNGFFLVIEARDPIFAEEKTKALLEEIGGTNVTVVEDE
jgi:hypothetical protein